MKRELNSGEVMDELTNLFILRGVPASIRSDGGPELIAEAVRGSTAAVGAKTAHIEPRLPWQNGRGEGFNARLRDDLLNGEAFYSLREARSSSKMEETLRYQTTSQCIVLPPTGARNDRANGVQANHALTFKPGHLGSANQKPKQRQHVRTDNLRAEFFGLKELINDE